MSARDADAFERIYLEHETAIYEYLARRLGEARAEEGTAETFSLAWQRFASLGPVTCERTWLLKIAVEYLESVRRDELEYLQRVMHDRRIGGSTTADTCAEHLAPRIARALTDLGPLDRDLVTLHSWAELGHASLAELTGMPVRFVTQRLRMAERFVRQRADVDQ